MKHFIDLPAHEIFDLIENAHSIGEVYAGERLDGSFIKVAKDENGRIYVQRKSDVKYYSLDDWPVMAWTNDFRAAHILLEEIGERLEPNQYVSFELISGPLANSIEYNIAHDTNYLVITDSNIRSSFDQALGIKVTSMPTWLSVFGEQSKNPITFGSTSTLSVVSKDGVNLKLKPETKHWSILKYQPSTWYAHTLLTYNIIHYLNSCVNVEYAVVKVMDVVDCKLNKRPDFIKEDDWKSHRKEIVSILEEKRREFRKKMESIFIGHLRKVNLLEARTEGIVLHTAKGIFKIVDREYFGQVNNFTHIVKYWLMGGRRPNRPSFLSRTASWPLERRLARLDVLRERFMRRYHELSFARPGDNILSYSHPQLYKRTIVLFAEIREGLINGRFGVQG